MAGTTYELRLRGPISDPTLRILEDLDMRSDTILSGMIVDQAELHGLLDRIRDLGLEIIYIHQIANDSRAGNRARPSFEPGTAGSP